MAFTGRPIEVISWLSEQPQDKRYTVKEHRTRRSLTANAYYWVLVNKLARKMHLSDTEVHITTLKQYGVCDVFSVKSSVPLDGYFEYFDVFGTGTLNGQEYNHVRVYKGSSKMDSQEFSRLLEGIRYECEEQGIDVLTPSEIAELEYVEKYGEEG